MNHKANRHQRLTPEERFWLKVEKTESCWIWIGACKGSLEYGNFYLSRGVYVYAHHFSWELHFGPIPEGKQVLHSCDMPRCVNPGHLEIGTQCDNVYDALTKGHLVRGSDGKMLSGLV
jgi:hypothetical protein